MDRRQFLKSVAALGAVSLASAAPLRALATPEPGIRAVLFDAFPIFDPRPVFTLAQSFAPGDGGTFVELWRTKQFEYTWLRTAGRQYQDFWTVTREALRHAARARKVTLTQADEDRLMSAYLTLETWPDVLPALRALKGKGLKLGFLSNFTLSMLERNIGHAGLMGVFDTVLSTDRAQAFKPSPNAYQLGVDALGLAREEIAFVAFAGWDVAGAKWFGYPTYWVNRLHQPMEELAMPPDGTGSDLSALAAFTLRKPSTRRRTIR